MVSESLCAQDVDRQEQFKAVYLFHFANFIEWPKAKLAAGKQFNICTLNADNLVPYLNELAGESIKGKMVTIYTQPKQNQFSRCHIIFIDKQSDLMDKSLLSTAIKNNILLVSDKNSFVNKGGTIEYFIENNKLRIAINLTMTKKTSLKVSSKLLRIAKVVQ